MSCRVCLINNTRLHSVKNSKLLNLYEKLTNTKLNSEDTKPQALCCFCYQKLLRFHNFAQMALRSEKLFSHVYGMGHEVIHKYINEVDYNMKKHLSVATLPSISIDFNENNECREVTINDDPLSTDINEDCQITINDDQLSTGIDIIIKEEETIESDPLLEVESLAKDCTKNQLTSKDDTDNYTKEHDANVIDQSKPDDSFTIKDERLPTPSIDTRHNTENMPFKTKNVPNLNAAAQRIMIKSRSLKKKITQPTSNTPDITNQQPYIIEDSTVYTISPEEQEHTPQEVHYNINNQNITTLNNIYENQNAMLNNQHKMMKKLAEMSVQLQDIEEQRKENLTVTTIAQAKGAVKKSLCMDVVDNIKSLEILEKDLSCPKILKTYLEKYAILCYAAPGSGSTCAYRLIDSIFTKDFLCQCSWTGGSRGDNLKISFKKYKNVLKFFFEMIYYWDNTYTVQDNETFFKNLLRNALRRRESKNMRQSTKKRRRLQPKGDQLKPQQQRSTAYDNDEEDTMNNDNEDNTNDDGEYNTNNDGEDNINNDGEVNINDEDDGNNKNQL